VWHAAAEAAVAVGVLEESTISESSALASSIPATSAKVTLIIVGSTRRARDRPNWPSPPRPPPLLAARRKKNTSRPMKKSVGPNESRMSASVEVLCVADLALISTPWASSSASNWLPFQNAGTCVANSIVGIAFELAG
jgi:hypothetical protein